MIPIEHAKDTMAVGKERGQAHLPYRELWYLELDLRRFETQDTKLKLKPQN
jgi:hypothetical protein